MLPAFTLALAGFATLSLSMDRHQRDVLGRRLDGTRSRWLRRAGGLLLAASLAPCIAGDGWSLGPVGWLGALTLAACIVLLAITAASASGVLVRPAGRKGSPR